MLFYFLFHTRHWQHFQQLNSVVMYVCVIWRDRGEWKLSLLCFYVHVCVMASVYSCKCILLPTNTSPTTNIHTPTQKERKSGLCWFRGKDRRTTLILKQLGTEHKERGKLQEGLRNHHPWGSSPAAVCCHDACSHTHTNTRRLKQTRATVDLTEPASLAANHSAQRGGHGGGAE